MGLGGVTVETRREGRRGGDGGLREQELEEREQNGKRRQRRGGSEQRWANLFTGWGHGGF